MRSGFASAQGLREVDSRARWASRRGCAGASGLREAGVSGFASAWGFAKWICESVVALRKVDRERAHDASYGTIAKQ
jgi:hypothetical protein